MKTLFINTVTETLMVGLYKGNILIDSYQSPAKNHEAELLLPLVQTLLEKHPDGIDHIAVCVGPGGFTSARIGVSAANAIAFAKKIPIAESTVFDLYSDDATVVIPANAHEAWVKMPGEKPKFFQKEGKDLPLQGAAQFPRLENLHFEHRLLKPWYYKDAKITWNKNIHQHE